jgi:hypothetical protein
MQDEKKIGFITNQCVVGLERNSFTIEMLIIECNNSDIIIDE